MAIHAVVPMFGDQSPTWAKSASWISIAASVALVMPMLTAAHQALVTIRLYRCVPLADGIRTLHYTLRTRNGWVVLLPIMSVLVFGCIIPLRGISYPYVILLPVVLLHLNILTLYATPPSVLLLASSRWESVRLFNLIERGIFPYRVVVLLEPSQTTPWRHSAHHFLHFEVDNLRILGPHNWRDVVDRMAERVPIIVLDTRLASPAVVEETCQIIQKPFRDKTLFVVAEDGSAPAIAATGSAISLPEYRFARLGDVVGALKDLGLSETTSPDDSPLLARVSFERISKQIAQRMAAVARTGKPFTDALKAAERVNGHTPFVVAAQRLAERLTGEPGEGALEIFAQLSDDIAETEQFITVWSHVGGDVYQSVIACADAVYRELCQLQQVIDHAPPIFLLRNEEILRSLRNR